MSKSKKSGGIKKTKKTEEYEEKITETPIFAITEEPEKLSEPDIRKITIELEGFENILPVNPSSDIKTEIKFVDHVIGETALIPITDEMNLPIKQSFEFECDINNSKEIDKLISNPVILTVTQHFQTNPEIIDKPKEFSQTSLDSVFSIYEAIAEDKQVIEEVRYIMNKKKKSKEKKKDKISKKSSKKSIDKKSSSTLSKKSKKTSSLKSAPSKVNDSVTYGICILDLIPLIFSNQSFVEALPIKPQYSYMDERLQSYKLFPKLIVKISINESIQFLKKPEILYVTVESIYNLPSIMKSNMNYKIAFKMPDEHNLTSVIFSNPLVWFNNDGKLSKTENLNWPGTHIETNYKGNNGFQNIQNLMNVNIMDSLENPQSMLIFNSLKRNYYFCEGKTLLAKHLTDYRHIVIEFLVEEIQNSKTDASNSESSLKKGKSKSKEKREIISEEQPPLYLHLMACVNLSDLLHPGVKKTRVAAQFRTFQENEALNLGGLKESYFFPKPKVEPIEIVEIASKTKKEKKGSEKSSKKSKEKKSKTSDKSKGSKKDVKKGSKRDMKDLLPPKPELLPPEEPSQEVYNEDGKPCFIVIEIELETALIPPKSLEEISEDYNDFIKNQNLPTLMKIPLTPQLALDIHTDTVKRIIQHTYNDYAKYLSLKNDCHCDNQIDFINYLRRTGCYQKYLMSLNKSIRTYVSNKLPGANFQEWPDQQQFISNVYTKLMENINGILNTIADDEILLHRRKEQTTQQQILFYAKQCMAFERYSEADRYYLQLITVNDAKENGHSWFEYAIFKFYMKEIEEAIYCLTKVLKIEPIHHLGLLMNACMLSNLDKINEAEICFNKLFVLKPKWPEAWLIISLFYEKTNRLTEMKHAQIMAETLYINTNNTVNNNCIEDLVWTENILPKTLFFDTACLLLKLELYDWAEMILVHEFKSNYGLANYLMAAICYKKEMYFHALEHLNETQTHYGSDYAVASLRGHCYLHLKDFQQAKEQYYYALQSYNRPDNMQLTFINCSHTLGKLNEFQQARKLLILAIKYNPTPYTWLKLGEIYYTQRDLLSAEECFLEANSLDNRCGEVWGYLALINIELNRKSEAELCHREAIKNNLKKTMILKAIEKALDKLKN